MCSLVKGLRLARQPAKPRAARASARGADAVEAAGPIGGEVFDEASG